MVLYRYDGKQAESRSTGEGEVLPLIYGLAGIERKAVPDRDPYPGYPLQARTDLAQVWFYGTFAAAYRRRLGTGATPTDGLAFSLFASNPFAHPHPSPFSWRLVT